MTKATRPGIWLLCAALVFVSACAGRSESAPGKESTFRDRITESELSDVDAVDAFAAVQQLRPTWLRSRGATSFTDPMGTRPTVYVDNMRYSEIAALSAIPVAEISEIRYISGLAAYRGGGVAGTGGGDGRDRSVEQPRRDDKTTACDTT